MHSCVKTIKMNSFCHTSTYTCSHTHTCIEPVARAIFLSAIDGGGGENFVFLGIPKSRFDYCWRRAKNKKK